MQMHAPVGKHQDMVLQPRNAKQPRNWMHGRHHARLPGPSPHPHPSPRPPVTPPGWGTTRARRLPPPSHCVPLPPLLGESPAVATSLRSGPAPGCHGDGEDIYRCWREREAQLRQGGSVKEGTQAWLYPLLAPPRLMCIYQGAHSLLATSAAQAGVAVALFTQLCTQGLSVAALQD